MTLSLYPKSIRGERVGALIRAAAQTPCHCLSDSARAHDGMCISCWALTKKIGCVEALIAANARQGHEPSWSLGDILERAQHELNFRRASVAERRAGGERYD